MNNVTLFNGSQNLPAHVQATLASRKPVALLVPGGESIPRISFKGNRFHKIKDGEDETLHAPFMEIAIVGAIDPVSRLYYASAYDPSAEPAAPDCWSTDGRLPDAAVPQPMADSCQMCPMNAKGSGQNGSKACSFKKRLMVVDVNEPDQVYQMDIAAMSIFGESYPQRNLFSLQALSKILAKQGISDPIVCVIRMEFDPQSSVPKLLFTVPDFWNEDELARILATVDASQDFIATQTAAIITNVGASAPAPAPAPAPAASGRGRMTSPAQGSGPAAGSGRQAAAAAPVQQTAPQAAAPSQPARQATTRGAGRAAAQQAPQAEPEILSADAPTPFDPQPEPPPARSRMAPAQQAPTRAAATQQAAVQQAAPVAAPTAVAATADDLAHLLDGLQQ